MNWFTLILGHGHRKNRKFESSLNDYSFGTIDININATIYTKKEHPGRPGCWDKGGWARTGSDPVGLSRFNIIRVMSRKLIGRITFLGTQQPGVSQRHASYSMRSSHSEANQSRAEAPKLPVGPLAVRHTQWRSQPRRELDLPKPKVCHHTQICCPYIDAHVSLFIVEYPPLRWCRCNWASHMGRLPPARN